jgi:serine/threonine protein kinase
MLLWQLLTDDIPFGDRRSDFQIQRAITAGNLPPKPASGNPILIKLYEQCVSVAPSKRPSWAEIVNKLRNSTVPLFPNVDRDVYEEYQHRILSETQGVPKELPSDISESTTDPVELVRLGRIHEHSKPPNYERAVECYLRAVNQGYLLGKYYYGRAILHGRGVPKNAERGIELLTEAAERHVIGAILELVEFYQNP